MCDRHFLGLFLNRKSDKQFDIHSISTSCFFFLFFISYEIHARYFHDEYPHSHLKWLDTIIQSIHPLLRSFFCLYHILSFIDFGFDHERIMESIHDPGAQTADGQARSIEECKGAFCSSNKSDALPQHCPGAQWLQSRWLLGYDAREQPYIRGLRGHKQEALSI